MFHILLQKNNQRMLVKFWGKGVSLLLEKEWKNLAQELLED